MEQDGWSAPVAGAPETMEEAWALQELRLASLGVSPTLAWQLKRAFFAGAMTFWSTSVRRTGRSESDAERVQRLQHEVLAFVKQYGSQEHSIAALATHAAVGRA